MGIPSASYIIQGGQAGSDRLDALTRLTWSESEEVLRRAGIKPGMRCLDVGCGNGAVSLKLAQWVGPQGSVVGIDADESVLRIAREKVQGRNVKFLLADLEKEPVAEGQPFDLVYLRFILSHLRNPKKVLQKVLEALRPGGLVVVEDVNFPGHYCSPPCKAFERYVEFYIAAAEAKGADATIGPHLAGMFLESGIEGVGVRIVCSAFQEGEGKEFSLLTLKRIREAVVSTKVASGSEVDQVIRELEDFTRDPRSILSMTHHYQVWGRKPKK